MASAEEMMRIQKVEDSAPKQQVGAAPGGGAGEQTFSSAPSSDQDKNVGSERRVTLQDQQRGLATIQMIDDQMKLLVAQQKQQDDSILKAMQLRNNQNPVLNNNPYINAKSDLETSKRRVVEESKYQEDELTRAEQQSIMYQKNQYLTQQIYANEKWGIPSLGSDVKVGQEYFTDR